MTGTPTKKKPRLYRGLTPEQLAAERRERVLEAGLDLFSDKGFANSPIELICSEAKVATRHFYEQFDGREAVLRAVFDDIVTQLGEHISAGLAKDTSPLAQRVSDAVHGGVMFLLEDPRRARIFCIESVGVSKAMEQHRRRSVHDVARLVETYANFLVGVGEMPERNYHLPAVAVAGMVIELMAEWLVEDTGLSAGEIAREAVILLRAIITGARNYEPSSRPPSGEQ